MSTYSCDDRHKIQHDARSDHRTITFAHIEAKMSELAERCKHSHIEINPLRLAE
jgi:hypothetical protein